MSTPRLNEEDINKCLTWLRQELRHLSADNPQAEGGISLRPSGWMTIQLTVTSGNFQASHELVDAVTQEVQAALQRPDFLEAISLQFNGLTVSIGEPHPEATASGQP